MQDHRKTEKKNHAAENRIFVLSFAEKRIVPEAGVQPAKNLNQKLRLCFEPFGATGQ